MKFGGMRGASGYDVRSDCVRLNNLNPKPPKSSTLFEVLGFEECITRCTCGPNLGKNIILNYN
jgi:hypothetical protein